MKKGDDYMRFGKYACVVLLMLGLLAVLGGCEFGISEHVHTFSKWAITKEPTCVDTGVQSRSCEECGYVETEKIAELGHTTVKDAMVNSTCTTDGLTEGSHCGVCGQILVAQEAIPAFGHAPLKDYPVEATCTTEGLSEGSHCYICGTVLEPQVSVPATGHKYDNITVVTPADCMHMGLKMYSCIWCGLSYTDTYTTTEHTIVKDHAVAATCTTDGLSEGSHCGVCQLVFAAQNVIPATGHKEVTDDPVEPTCTTEGWTDGTHCETCGEVLRAPEVVAALGHQNIEEILQEATCLQPGLKRCTCTVCGTVTEGPYEMPQYTATELYGMALQYVGEIAALDSKGNATAVGVGFVLSSDGVIITNYHVIKNCYKAQITINNVAYPIVSVLAYDKELDLAVVKIHATGLTTAKICANPLQAGQAVYAIGYPNGLNSTCVEGVIQEAQCLLNGFAYVQHDATISLSNSGGPLLNVYGEVVGINTLTVSGNQGKNLSVFVSELEKLGYGAEIPLAQFYVTANSPFERLMDLIFAEGKLDKGDTVIYDYFTAPAYYIIYALGYDADTGIPYVMLYYMDDNVVGTRIDLMPDGKMSYSCSYKVNGKEQNVVTGTINALTYTSTSELTYDTYTGLEGFEGAVMEMYKPYMNMTVAWLDAYLKSSGMDLSAAAIGFVAFSN